MPPRTRTATVPIDQIGQSILILRGQRVLLDSDLAALYGVTTKRLNEQVKRNIDRFPQDFMFSLRAPEWDALRSQNATANIPRSERGGRRSLPNAFTEHGAIQAANVLNSPRAIEMGIYVVRAFVRFRELLSSNKELARQFAQLEVRLNKKLADHDDAIAAILSAIRELMNPPETKRRGIGFTAKI
jgi:hypothetical protein